MIRQSAVLLGHSQTGGFGSFHGGVHTGLGNGGRLRATRLRADASAVALRAMADKTAGRRERLTISYASTVRVAAIVNRSGSTWAVTE